jgi:hypothetical protein
MIPPMHVPYNSYGMKVSTYGVTADAHVELIEPDLFANLLNDLDDVESKEDSIHCLLARIAFSGVDEADAHVAVSNSVQLEKIVVDAQFIELRE